MREPYYIDPTVTLHHGDCLDVLRELPDASVDAVVTDPPYGLEFMGKAWDSFRGDAWRSSHGITGTGYTDGGIRLPRPSFGGGDSANPTCATCGGRKRGAKKCACIEPEWRVKGKPLDQRDNNAAQMRAFQEWCELWTAECLRVLKPGGHMLAFGGTRTWHRLACAVEDAGFEVRDSIAWLYGSGFPKSLDVSKAIDKAAGAEREVVSTERSPFRMTDPNIGDTGSYGKAGGDTRSVDADGYIVRAVTAPATPDAERWQGWGTALKPAHEPIVVARKPLAGTVAANVLAHGTGALNVDGCRVEGAPELRGRDAPGNLPNGNGVTHGAMSRTPYEVPAGRWPANVVLDESQAAALDEQSGEQRDGVAGARTGERNGYDGGWGAQPDYEHGYGGTGGASRFMYVAKADASERVRVNGTAHPTVKPLALMRWLVRLVTPPGGTVLEPFAGSGTTVEACLLEGFRCIAIEREADYLPLIRQRINRRRDPVEAIKATGDDGGLFDLLGGTA